MGIGAHLGAGFTAGLVSSVALQPLDLVKTRVQQRGTGLARAYRGILEDAHTHGVLAFWRGTLPSALRTSFGASLYLATLGRLREVLALPESKNHSRASSSLPQLSMTTNLALGAGTRAAIGFITMPLTVLKTRLESNLYEYVSLRQAFENTIKVHGWRSLWAGFGATTLRDAPYAGIYVLCYERAKDTFASSQKPAALINMVCAAAASVAASTITAPFDTARTRMQLQPVEYRRFGRTISQIIRQEGVLTLFNGVGLRLTRKALSSGIAWCIYEEVVRKCQ